MENRIRKALTDHGIKITDQRKIIIDVLCNSNDHPDVVELHRRASNIDSKIGIATVYRTLKVLEDSKVIDRHDFGDGRARYEAAGDEHHDHLIDIKTGKVIEFQNDMIEKLQEEIASSFGYKLIDHKLELYCIKIKDGLNE